jgi:hypothetical protein
MIEKDKKQYCKFYTKEFIAKFCCGFIDFTLYKTIIEPSAGNGSFIEFLPRDKTIAIDIAPEREDIIEIDYFNFNFIDNTKNPILCIGNPPFGKRANLAIDFFNHSAKYASTIAFIVPLQFRKWSVQSKLNANFFLQDDIDLLDNSFFYDKRDYKIRCCFQIWQHKDFKEVKEDLRIKEKPKTKIDYFDIWQHNNTKQTLKYFDKEIYKWDFAIPRQGYYDYSLKIYEPSELQKNRQWMFIKANDNDTLKLLLSIDYVKLSKQNTTIPGFGKNDIIKEFLKLKGEIV